MYAMSPETLIKAYALGVFPMAEAHDDDRIFFVDPEWRGILPLDDVHIPRSLKKRVRQAPYHVTINQNFEGVIDGCREITATRQDSWINPQIRQLYIALINWALPIRSMFGTKKKRGANWSVGYMVLRWRGRFLASRCSAVHGTRLKLRWCI